MNMPASILMKFNLLFICSFFFYSISSGQNSKLDSLIKALPQMKEDTTKVKKLIGLSAKHRGMNKMEEASMYADQALVLAKKLNYKKGVGDAYVQIATAHNIFGRYSEVIQFSQKAYGAYESARDKASMAMSLNNIGQAHRSMGNYPAALENLFASIKIKDELGNKRGVAISYVNIGLTFREQGDVEKALEYFDRSLKTGRELKDKEIIANVLGNMAAIYKDRGQDSIALSMYFESLKLFSEIEKHSQMVIVYGSIGTVYSRPLSTRKIKPGDPGFETNFKKAEYYYRMAIDSAKKYHVRQEEGDALCNIGHLFNDAGKSDKAIDYYLKSIVIFEEVGDMDAEKTTKKELSDMYFRLGKFKEAYFAHVDYMNLKDSVYSDKNSKAMGRIEAKASFDKLEALEHAEQKRKDDLVQKEMEMEKVLRNSFIAGFALMLVLSVIIFRSYKQKKNDNKIIAEQKIKVEEQRDYIEEKQKEIIDSIRYAKRIQRALIASEKYVETNLNRLMTRYVK
jgi:tetratricopeptide (TPR) repeat protein